MRRNGLLISIKQLWLIAIFIISVLICIAANTTHGYLLFLLPLTYLVCYVFVLNSLCRKSLTVKIITFTAALRYILLPIMHAIHPVFSFSRYSVNDVGVLNDAILLMCYELVFVSIFLFLLFAIKREKMGGYVINLDANRVFDLRHNRYGIVIIFAFTAIVIASFYPQVLSQISFVSIRLNTAQRMALVAASASSTDSIIRQMFVTAILALYVVILTSIKSKASKNHMQFAFMLSLFFTILITGMIVSEQRSSQVYSAFAGIILLIQLYPQKRKTIIAVVCIAAGSVIAMLSVYKVLYAFMYNSYLEAISNSGMDLQQLTGDLEIYLLGPVTVASALQFAALKPISFSLAQLLFDFGRSTIGISFLLKKSSLMLTSEAYNQYVTSGIAKSGYLIPITGQGVAFLGFILAPIIICIFYAIAIKLERIMFESRSTYAVFFVAYAYIRLATCMVSANINSVVVASTTVAISAGTIYVAQKFFDKILYRPKTFEKSFSTNIEK